MPFRSRISLASETGSSTKLDSSNDRPVSSFSMEKISPRGPRSDVIGSAGEGTAAEPTLPPPVQQASSFSSRKNKKARIDGGIKKNLQVHWDRFRRKLSNGTAPSSSSAFEESTAGGSSYHRSTARQVVAEDADEKLDEVVVDREWAEDLKTTSATHSDHGVQPERGAGSNPIGGTNTDRESLAMHGDGFWGSCVPLIWIRWRVWPFLLGFFYTRFLDDKAEQHYNRESWFLRKVCNIYRYTLLVITSNRTLLSGLHASSF